MTGGAIWTGQAIVEGTAEGVALITRRPLSFLGDIDIRTGRVVEAASDIAGETLAGQVLVMPDSRGSAGAWRFLYQLHMHGTMPAALVTEAVPDPSVVQGAIMADLPVVAGVAGAIANLSADAPIRLRIEGPHVRRIG